MSGIRLCVIKQCKWIFYISEASFNIHVITTLIRIAYIDFIGMVPGAYGAYDLSIVCF